MRTFVSFLVIILIIGTLVGAILFIGGSGRGGCLFVLSMIGLGVLFIFFGHYARFKNKYQNRVDKIYCENCKYSKYPCTCNNPNNLKHEFTALGGELIRGRSFFTINKNNNCKWFVESWISKIGLRKNFLSPEI